LARPRARCAALGLPAQDGVFVAVLVEPGPGGEDAELRARLHRELRSAGIAALVGELSPGRLGVLLALRPGRPWRPAAERLSRTARELAPGATVGAGAEVADLAGVARSFREAARVMEATPPGRPLPADRSFHEPADVDLGRLLYALREDPRIQEYTERRLGRLVDHDARHGTDLLSTLGRYLDAAGSKTGVARRGGLSRESVYQRLRTVERLLGTDLASGERRTELHVALTALRVLRSG
jgi:purine catabolism regulator